MNKIKVSSVRSFGIVFFLVFIIIALYPLLNKHEIRIWSLIVGFIFLFLGMVRSPILKPLNLIWFKFGLFLGKFISPIVMGVVYFLVVTPTGLIMKALGKDILGLKRNKNSTYWLEKDNSNNNLKNQF